MAAIKMNRITNAVVYLDGASELGKCDEITLPDLKTKQSEHKTLGMVGTIQLPHGFEKMEGKIKWNSFYHDIAAKTCNPFTPVQLQVRNNVETYTSMGRIEQVPLVTFLTVSFSKHPAGAFKQNENADFESDFSATSLKQLLDGKEVLFIDFMSNIYRVNGVDQLDVYRRNTGG